MYYNVRLIAITYPISSEFNSSNDSEDLISYCARVSNPNNQTNFETSAKLLKYCINNKHWSIFQMANVVIEIKTTRDIGRQILRHRSFTFQEFSTRYAELNIDDFVFREARLQDYKNRQKSIETNNKELHDGWLIWQRKVASVSKKAYKWAIENGIAKEQARSVLPEGMTPSVMYMNGSLREWIHYVDVRQNEDVQKEHRLIALDIKKLLMEKFDFLKEYWNNNESV